MPEDSVPLLALRGRNDQREFNVINRPVVSQRQPDGHILNPRPVHQTYSRSPVTNSVTDPHFFRVRIFSPRGHVSFPEINVKADLKHNTTGPF